MTRIQLGSTGITIEKNGFGCLPIQLISKEDAAYLLHKAVDGGMTYFDTARAYSDSEEKVGCAFAGMRDKIVIATKTGAQTVEGMWADLETSLRNLQTDYIDVYQFHNPAFCPRPGGRGRSATSPSPTTAWRWPMRRLTPGCTRCCNSPSAICPAPRSRSWWRNAGPRAWALWL